MVDCLAKGLSQKVIKLVGVTAKPYPGCKCLWCCEAQLAKGKFTLWPACGCEPCTTHPANHTPDHVLRVCDHRAYWTVNPQDRDGCDKCKEEEVTREALSNLPLPDYPTST